MFIFRRLPLAVKLILIGMIPLLLLIYLTYQVYREKNEKLGILEGYIQKIQQSADLSSLIDALQTERKISFDYALGNAASIDMNKARAMTDSLLSNVENSEDPNVYGFKDYTSLHVLDSTRSEIDKGRIAPNSFMHFYSNTIFRLNTLNSIPSSAYLQSIYKDMVSHKLLSEMSTYLGIIRSNIYNVLVTRRYMIETLVGITGTFDVYKSYEKEFLMKASPDVTNGYHKLNDNGSMKTTNQYLDTLFKRYSFDTTVTAQAWWTTSSNSIQELSQLRLAIWNKMENRLNSLYQREKFRRDRTLFLFAFILVVLVLLVSYSIFVITSMLGTLKVAAQKISRGSTDIHIKKETDDVIGSLTDSISEIASTNKQLAQAAEQIGNGNFAIRIAPRSINDVLGNAIVKMKDALQAYSERMETMVNQRTEELERSNYHLQQFAHVASHDLKEPVRKIKTFSDRLINDNQYQLNEDNRNYLYKINHAATRMNRLIDSILNYSSLQAAQLPFECIDLNEIVNEVKTDLELLIEQKKAAIDIGPLPKLEGVPSLMNQLFYNLINNSLKFSKEHVLPVIRVFATKHSNEHGPLNKGEYYEITVADNGIGFDPQFGEKIFETFSRLHSTAKYEGTGLGLALCKRIVEYHHGRISAHGSVDGAIFKIVLPKKQTPQ